MVAAAIVYDFDGTLCDGNMQEHGLLQRLGHSRAKEFWDEGGRIAREQDADEVLVYMWRLMMDARGSEQPLTRSELRGYGTKLTLFPGVETWFKRIDAFGASIGLAVDHYVVSSGLLEIIEGSSIAARFKHIFASHYMYSHDGEAIAPAVAINYTTKTQYLFRINKGILNSWDRTSLNSYMAPARRPIPFSRMVFIGDGDTDIPSMKMMKHQGGEAIAVFGNWDVAASRNLIHRLIEEERVGMVAPADYRENSQLEVVVKGVLGRFALASGLEERPNVGVSV